MTQFKLSPKFYVVFSLLLSAPALYLSSHLQSYLKSLEKINFLQELAKNGLVEAPTTVSLILLSFWLVNNWILKLNSFISFPFLPPDVNGRYKGTLVSSYNNKKLGIVIEIRQTLTELSIDLYSDEDSKSYSLIAGIGKNEQGNFSLAYLYQYKSRSVDHDRSKKDHEGAAVLEVFDKGNQLTGFYFNNPRDRGRFGKIQAKRINKKLLGHN